MSDTFRIRRYTAADHDDVLHLHRTVLKQTGAYLDNPEWDRDLDQIESVYLDGGDFLVAERDGKLFAMGALRRIDAQTAEVKRMRVLLHSQRSGYGQLIYDVLEQRARALGYKRLVLDTSTLQVAAQQFYRKNGYVETNRKDYEGITFIFFAKEL